MNLVKYYLKKAKMKTVDQAEDFNHHSIVALDYAFEHLNHELEMVQRIALQLSAVSEDLCKNDYKKPFLHEVSRQFLIVKRNELMSKIGYMIDIKRKEEIPF